MVGESLDAQTVDQARVLMETDRAALKADLLDDRVTRMVAQLKAQDNQGGFDTNDKKGLVVMGGAEGTHFVPWRHNDYTDYQYSKHTGRFDYDPESGAVKQLDLTVVAPPTDRNTKEQTFVYHLSPTGTGYDLDCTENGEHYRLVKDDAQGTLTFTQFEK